MGRHKCKLSSLSLCFKCAIWGVVVLLIKGSRKVNYSAGSYLSRWLCCRYYPMCHGLTLFLIQVWPKNRASRAHIVGPGVEMRDDPVERRRRNNSLDRDWRSPTSLE